jgi:hypothetical protein
VIKISREDAFKLNKDYGVKYGENGISRTHGHKKHYYLTESEYNLRSLLKFSLNDEAKEILDKINVRKRHYNKKKY